MGHKIPIQMIANSIILPTEQPIDIQDIKRALVTYDKIYIPSPDDRELIPSNTYTNSLFASLNLPTMPIGMPDGPIKPLGKVDNYDLLFEKVIDECKFALAQGSIEILGAPKYTETVTLGATPIPEDTPNPFFTYINYRQMSENSEFVNLMSKGLDRIQYDKIRDANSLLPSGRENEEQSVNGQKRPPKAMLSATGLEKDKEELLSKMCHTRIGTLVKYLGYSFIKDLHPFTTDVGYAGVISKLEFNFVGTVESIETNEELLKRQKRLSALHNVMVSEYIDPERINKLDVKQILKLRTKAWGKTQENRKLLIADLDEIALDCENNDKFKRACELKFDEFLKTTEDYRHEIDKLKLMIIFDANVFAYITYPEYQLLEKLLKAPSFETLLIVGGLGIQYAKQHIGTLMDIIKKAEERRRATGYGIYSSYKYLLN
jgi:hypothetical protein